MAVALSPNAKQQFFTDGSTVAAGYKLHTYAAGTSTPLATYSNRAGTVENPNPITLDARGEATIYLTPGLVYDYVLRTNQGADVWTRPGVASEVTPGFVFAEDRGLKGDGSDETAAIQAVLDASAGKVLVLQEDKVYGTTGLTLPANTTLITNGATIKKIAASGTYAVTVGDDAVIDTLRVQVPGGSMVTDLAVKVSGHNFSADAIVVSSVGDGTIGNTVLIGSGVQGTVTSNVQIGRIDVTNCRSPITLWELRSSSIDFVKGTSYERGLYIRDCKSLVVRGGTFDVLAPGADGSAGENAVLIESVAADYACTDIYLHNITSFISGEHGFRLGGSKIIRNVHHDNCAAYFPGSGSAAVGGAGFKALGGTVSNLHEQVFYTNCTVIDGGQNNSNWSGIIAGLCDGVTIANCRVSKKTRPFSAMDGVWIDSCKNVNVIGTSAMSCRRYGIKITAETSVVCEHVSITGGSYHVAPAGFGVGVVINFGANAANVNNVIINGVYCSGGQMCVQSLVPGGGFSYNGNAINLTYRDPTDTTAGPPFQLGSGFTLNVNSPYYGTFAPQADNGSIYQDTTNGLVKIRKAGAWTTL